TTYVSAQLDRGAREVYAGVSEVAVRAEADFRSRDRPSLRFVGDPQDLPVAYVPEFAFVVPKRRHPEGDALNGPRGVGHGSGKLDPVADPILVLGEHEQAGNDVLHERLRAEGDDETGEAGGSDERAHDQAKFGE